MILDREKLFSALHQPDKECLYFLADNAGKQISPSSFTVQNVGKVNIPLSAKDVSQIRSAYKQNPQSESGASCPCQVPANSLRGISSDQNDPLTIAVGKLTASSLRNTFCVDLSSVSLNVKAKLDKLVSCRDSESFGDSFNFEKDPGMFGTLLLVLPQQRQRAGHLTMNYRNRDVHFTLEESKSSDLMVVCMAGPRSKTLRQKFKISADPGKHLTFLVFNLIWMDSFKLEGIISPDKFPHFVTAVKQADEALCGWRGASHANDKDTLQRRDLSPLEATKTKFLCVGLEEKYEARGFSLSQLKNNDKFIAQVLSCLNYLDVSLADVAIHRKEKLKVSHWTEALEKYVPCTELFHWTENGQNKLSSHPSFTDVNLSTALVGELKSVIEIDSRVPDASPLAKFYFQEIPTDLNRVGFKRCPVLVLRPKNPAEQEDQSLFYTTRDIVNKLPSALEDTYTGKGEIRRHLLTQITTVMNRIRRDDFEITSTTKPWFSQMDYCAKNWPAKTLFYVCHRLNAAEEGLFFLKMIAANKCFCSMHDTLNLTDDCIVKEFSILELVADFVKKFGWDCCREVVLEVFQNRTAMKADYFRMTTALLLGDCRQAAKELLNVMLDKLGNSVEKGGPHLVPVVETMRFIKEIEHIETQSAEDFFHKLVSALKVIPTQNYLFLVAELTVHLPQEGVTVCSRLIEDLVGNLPEVSFTGITPEFFLRTVKVLDRHLRSDVAHKLWARAVSDFIEQERKTGTLLHSFILSCETRADGIALLEDLSKIPGASKALNLFVNDYVCELKAAFLHESDAGELVQEPLNRLKFHLPFVCLAENVDTLSNETRIETMCRAFTFVDVSNLGKLILTFRTDNRLKKKKAHCLMYRRLLQEILKRTIVQVVEIASSHFLDLFECYLWFGESDLVDQFLRKITNNNQVDDCHSLPSGDLNVHIPRMFEIRGVCGDPSDYAVKIDKSTINALLKTWMMHEITKGSDPVHQSHSSAFIECFEVFQKIEMYQSKGEEEDVVLLFITWMLRLKPAALLYTILKMFDSEATRKGPSFKKFLHCAFIFRQMCLHLLRGCSLKEVLDTRVGHDETKQLFEALLWFSDEQVVSEFISSVETSGAELAKLSESLITCLKIQEEAAKTPIGRKAFTSLLDHCKQQKRLQAAPVSSWVIVGVKIEGEETFEKFLQSNVRKVTFGPYKLVSEAVSCASRLITNHSWGLAYSIKECSSGYNCEVLKMKQFLNLSLASKTLQQELCDLEDIRKKVLSESVHSLAEKRELEVLTDEVEILPPVKQIKVAEVVTLD